MRKFCGRKYRTGAVIFSALMIMVFMITACGAEKAASQNEYEKELLGKWAYIHEPDEMVAVFRDNGSAEFEKQKYQYSSDGQFISMINEAGENMNLRYKQNGDRMYIYIQSVYTREPDTDGEGVVGVWRCQEKNWTFEFSPKGTFMEDGAMTGYYEVNEVNKVNEENTENTEDTGTIKLMYGEALEDTVLYYQLREDGLFVEYPWLTVKMNK